MSQIDTAAINKLVDKPQSPTLDMNSKVKIGDKEMTVADLIAKAASSSAVEQRLAALEAESTSTKTAVNKMLSGKGTEDDARLMLKNLGYNGDQIEAYIEANFRQQAQQPKKPARQTLGDDDVQDEELTVEEKLLQKIEQLEERLAQQEQGSTEGRVQRIGEILDQTTRDKIRQDPYFRSLLNSKKRVDSSVDEGKILEIFASRARDEAAKLLKERRKMAGSFDETWIPGEVEKAVKSIFDEHKVAFVDPKYIGRAPEVVAAEEAVLNSAPVPEPKFDPKKPVGDLQAEAERHFADQLTRMAQAAANDTEA